MGVRAALVAGFVVTVTLAACGDGDEKTTSTTTATSPATTVSVSDLRARLLSVADLPGAGWKVGNPINEKDLEGFVGDPEGPCATVKFDPAVVKRLKAATGVQFEGTDATLAAGGKFLIQLVATGDPAQLDADIKALLDAQASCAAADATIKKLAISPLGDQRAAYAQGANHWGVARDDSIAVMLGTMELTAPQGQPQVSDTQFANLLETAVNKLNE